MNLKLFHVTSVFEQPDRILNQCIRRRYSHQENQAAQATECEIKTPLFGVTCEVHNFLFKHSAAISRPVACKS